MSLAFTRGQLASARIAPVFGSIAIAVAPLGEYCAPTPARTCSTSSCRAASMLSWSVFPGKVWCTSSIEIGCPIASLTIRLTPSWPRSTRLNFHSSPLLPWSPQPTSPRTCDAAQERG